MHKKVQNILYALKYEKLDTAVDSVRKLSAKYYTIAADGNQTIAGTLREYIGKIEYLFINSVKVEYNYYVKKEQAKAEQVALREQMRMEAAEKKALEEERKKVEKEESKYQAEILKLTDTISSASDDEKAKLEERIAELQNQLASVAEKKEEIIHLQNGKAGTVYVISNLGSFGEDVFKIGMTRRADPTPATPVNQKSAYSSETHRNIRIFVFLFTNIASARITNRKSATETAHLRKKCNTEMQHADTHNIIIILCV